MGIDFIIMQDCEAKQQLSPEGLIEKIKTRTSANSVIEQISANTGNTDPNTMTFMRVVYTPEGAEQQECNVSELLEETKELGALEPNCANCPANFLKEPFGCYGYVHYPIPAAAEEWLMSLLPDDINSTAGLFLTKAISDFNYKGQPVKQMRKEKGLFFESSSPVQRKWGSFLRGTKINSNQILQMMFSVGAVEPGHAALLCLFFGLIPHNIPPEAFIGMMENPKILAEQADIPADKIPEEAAANLASFLIALIKASDCSESIGIDA